MWAKLWKEIGEARVFTGVPADDVVSTEELAGLPPAVDRYLRFFGVAPSQAKHWSLRVRWTGRFRMAPSGSWMPIEAVQYDLRSPVTRVFHMRARMMGVVPVLARDTYVEGRGSLLAKVYDLVPVARGSGSEFDQGELVTWLNDCVMFAPSMLLGPTTQWCHVDTRSFEIVFSDRAQTVRAKVGIDERGAPIHFETTDRFLADPDDPKHPLIRGRWSTPIETWQRIGARTFPERARATWHLPSGNFTYAEFVLDRTSLAFDLPPASANCSTRSAMTSA
jgi:hypothetical protein